MAAPGTISGWVRGLFNGEEVRTAYNETYAQTRTAVKAVRKTEALNKAVQAAETSAREGNFFMRGWKGTKNAVGGAASKTISRLKWGAGAAAVLGVGALALSSLTRNRGGDGPAPVDQDMAMGRDPLAGVALPGEANFAAQQAAISGPLEGMAPDHWQNFVRPGGAQVNLANQPRQGIIDESNVQSLGQAL